MILHLVWLAAIAHMRGPGRDRLPADRSRQWDRIVTIYHAIGYPPFPMGLA